MRPRQLRRLSKAASVGLCHPRIGVAINAAKYKTKLYCFSFEASAPLFDAVFLALEIAKASRARERDFARFSTTGAGEVLRPLNAAHAPIMRADLGVAQGPPSAGGIKRMDQGKPQR
jgi:hypothetical protein